MSAVPLRLGPLNVPGFVVHRSGLRWLHGDGYPCRAGEALAFCNVRLMPSARGNGRPAFPEEQRDLQAVLASPVAGRVYRDSSHALGGFLSRLPFYETWSPDVAIGQVERDAAPHAAEAETPLLMVAGRRVTELAEDRSGLLTGWHERSRAWWGQGGARHGTVLGLGVCDVLGVMRGEQQAFLEWFEAVEGPAQVVHVPDDALVPCSAVVLEQHTRSEAQLDAVVADCTRALTAGSCAPTPRDWIFAGALLSALRRAPLRDQDDLLTRRGLERAGPPDAVVLSIQAEPPRLLRHRRLGYALHCHAYRLAEVGPALRAWLMRDFERVRRTLDDIARDLRAVVDLLRAQGTRCLMLNAMSSSGAELTEDHAAFVGNKDKNLMLCDLSRDHDMDIVDVDAITADLGGAQHLPVGVHASGALEASVRAEVQRILHARRVPGFRPRA